MSHGFFSVTFSTHHYRHPFTCSCQVIDQREDHSLNTIQKVFVVALALFIGSITYGIGAIPAFYLTAAILKKRNVVWMNHVRAHSGMYTSSWYWFTPRWWGFSVPIHRRGGGGGLLAILEWLVYPLVGSEAQGAQLL